MGRRMLFVCAMVMGLVLGVPVAAFACGGLIAPGHAEVLQKATTLAAWHRGYEHYVTGFQFAGGAESFGYIIPLPGNPSKIEKAGEWTLERLEREINPVEAAPLALAAAGRTAADSVQVLQKVRVDALDITVVRGGGRDVAAWAGKNGFDLTSDTPDVLGAYSSRGAIFALAKFDTLAASKEGLTEGEGAVIHFTIPTAAPWIPLRILSLGKAETEIVNADLFILTDDAPSLSPRFALMPGVTPRFSGPASPLLLSDLRSDRGMEWLPKVGMWLSAFEMHTPAGSLSYELSIDGGQPASLAVASPTQVPLVWPWVAAGVLGAMVVFGAIMAAPGRTARQRPA